MAFIDDIQSRDTALFPAVEIGVVGNGVRIAYPYTIRLSTKPVTLFQASSLDWEDIPLSGDWFYSPLLLSSPSIKESIDLENRKYKISNVSLKISNVEYNGERISDNPELKINALVNIFWMSPSVEKYLGAGTETGRNYGYHAYLGAIRAITHDEKTCNITLEDISQSELHRDVPVTLLGTGVEVPEKYKNKPVPMVYGYVDKSPSVEKHDPESYDNSLIEFGGGASTGNSNLIMFDRSDMNINLIRHNVYYPNLDNLNGQNNTLWIFDDNSEEYHSVMSTQYKDLTAQYDEEGELVPGTGEYDSFIPIDTQYINNDNGSVNTIKWNITNLANDDVILNLMHDGYVQCYRKNIVDSRWCTNPLSVWNGFGLTPNPPFEDNLFHAEGDVYGALDIGNYQWQECIIKNNFVPIQDTPHDVISRYNIRIKGWWVSYLTAEDLYFRLTLNNNEFDYTDTIFTGAIETVSDTFEGGIDYIITNELIGSELTNIEFKFQAVIGAIDDSANIFFNVGTENQELGEEYEFDHDNIFNLELKDKVFFADVEGRV